MFLLMYHQFKVCWLVSVFSALLIFKRGNDANKPKHAITTASPVWQFAIKDMHLESIVIKASCNRSCEETKL